MSGGGNSIAHRAAAYNIDWSHHEVPEHLHVVELNNPEFKMMDNTAIDVSYIEFRANNILISRQFYKTDNVWFYILALDNVYRDVAIYVRTGVVKPWIESGV